MFLLDTDTCSYIIRDRPASMRLRLESAAYAGLAVSEIVAAELQYGAARHPSRSEQLRSSVENFLSRLEVLPWTGAMAYAEIRCDLERRGLPIGGNDLLIAAHALTLGATLVTNNLRHFRRIRGLACESWA
jgi:tRNA(fMet)-specific endonuclease VapC